MSEPIRENQTEVRCLCVLLSTRVEADQNTHHHINWCKQETGPDQPFCEGCEDRHPEAGNDLVVTTIIAVRAGEIGWDGTTPVEAVEPRST